MTISLDDEATWPPEVSQLLEAHLSVLQAYEQDRRRINAQLERDVTLRYSTPSNPHALLRDQVIARCDAALADHTLVGLHCTRLHDDEIAAVQRDGLWPLSSEGLVGRVQARVAAGDIPDYLGIRLFGAHQAGDRHRTGLIWFIFTHATLRDEHAVCRFFQSWGGEALYNSHEHDDETGPLLRGIGVPCIVEAAVPADRLHLFGSVGEALLAIYLGRRRIPTARIDGVEGYIQGQLEAAHIRRVVRASDPAFQQLTQHHQWRWQPK